jgi:predicted RNA-binding protein with PIN domain
MSVPLHVLLRPAVEVARRALRDLDADQVPADLRKVVSYAGGNLPPPLARALLDALEKYPWLREKAMEVWPEADAEAAGREGAAALFLQRPSGWELHLAVRAGEEGAAAAVAEGSAAERRIAELKRRSDVLGRKLKDQEKSAAARLAELEARLDDERNERKAGLAAASREDRALREEAAGSRAAAETARRERDELASELRRLRNEVAAERRARRSAEQIAAGAADTAGWDGDPVVLGARLDDVARMATPAMQHETVPSGAATVDQGFPATLSPDSVEAIGWLLGRVEPTTVLVDGYNIGFRLLGERRPGPARERVLPILERLTRLAAGPLKVVAVFDSAEEGTDGPPPGTGGPVGVRFTGPDHSADDEITRLASDLTGAVVVITSDRDVREAAEGHGAVALWAESLVAWAARR